MFRLSGFVGVCVFALAGCSNVPMLLEPPEEALGVGSNFFGADSRAFHKVMHYPNAVGLRTPGFIVGLEKAKQPLVTGPKVDEALLAKDANGTTRAYRRLETSLKAHLITHVTKYNRDLKGIFPGRITSCTSYSLVKPDGNMPSVSIANVGGRLSESMGVQQFPICPDWEPFVPVSATEDAPFAGAFSDSWRAIKIFRDNLQQTLCGSADVDKNGACAPKDNERYSHVVVIVMGWNTPQDNAVENFNSIIGHLIDEVEARKELPEADDKNALESFRPLVVGITWPSNWELSDILPLPDDVVRTISFPNKANDAKEIGISWLKALIQHAVLPARATVSDTVAPNVIYIGHSFGARATLTSLTQDQALVVPKKIFDPIPGSFKPGDRYIALQGAFKIEELLENEVLADGLSKKLTANGLKSVITTSAYDSANELAFWNTYAGMIDAHKKVCADKNWEGVDCAYIPAQGDPGALNYGLGLCDRAGWMKDPVRPRSDSKAKPFAPETWRSNGQSVLFLDISLLANCRAAFTGGGSHSDIYRRETARLLWDLIK